MSKSTRNLSDFEIKRRLSILGRQASIMCSKGKDDSSIKFQMDKLRKQRKINNSVLVVHNNSKPTPSIYCNYKRNNIFKPYSGGRVSPK